MLASNTVLFSLVPVSQVGPGAHSLLNSESTPMVGLELTVVLAELLFLYVSTKYPQDGCAVGFTFVGKTAFSDGGFGFAAALTLPPLKEVRSNGRDKAAIE